MAKLRAEVLEQKVIGQLKEGLDQETFDLVGGKAVYLRNSHGDPEDPDNQVYVVHGETEYGPFPQVRLLDLEHKGNPVFIVTDDDMNDQLFAGKTACSAVFDHIDDDTVRFDDAGEPYFRALDGEGERIVHGSWRGYIHEETGVPILHKGQVVYTATDRGETFLFCHDEEILEGFARLWVIDLQEYTDATDIICGAVKDKKVLQLRIRIA